MAGVVKAIRERIDARRKDRVIDDCHANDQTARGLRRAAASS